MNKDIETLKLELKQARKATDLMVQKLEAERKITAELRYELSAAKAKLKEVGK